MRSRLWHPEDWQPDSVASRAEIAKMQERPDDPIAALEEYYGESYASGLY